jgi:hypothetical protein
MFRSFANGARRILSGSVILLIPTLSLAFSTGPLDGHTNAPGESNCTACHFSFPLNSGAGMLQLTGLPAFYTPGEDYDLVLTLSDPVALRWGFQLTILEDGGSSIGSITVTDGGTQTSTTGNRTYLKHNLNGTAPGTPDAHSWTFTWTAPAAGAGTATLYVAGNAANFDGTELGDYIYATSFGTDEAVGAHVEDLPPLLSLHGAAPNPFNPYTSVRFDLERTVHARVQVLTVDGRLVATLADRVFPAGQQAVSWDGRDKDGRVMGSGVFVYVVEVDGVRRHGRMTLLK